MSGTWASLSPPQVRAAWNERVPSISSVFLWNNNGPPNLRTMQSLQKYTLILNSSAHVDCSTLIQQQLPMQRGLLHVWGDCSVSKVHIVQACGPEFEPCVKQWSIVAQSRVVEGKDGWILGTHWTACVLDVQWETLYHITGWAARLASGFRRDTCTSPAHIWIHANTHAHAPTRIWIRANVHLQQQKYNYMFYSFTRFLRKRGKLWWDFRSKLRKVIRFKHGLSRGTSHGLDFQI